MMKSKGAGTMAGAVGTTQLFPSYFKMELSVLIGLTKTKRNAYCVLIKCALVLLFSNIGYNVTSASFGGLLKKHTTMEIRSSAVICIKTSAVQPCQTAFTHLKGRCFNN